jgi:hypothetical protein
MQSAIQIVLLASESQAERNVEPIAIRVLVITLTAKDSRRREPRY